MGTLLGYVPYDGYTIDGYIAAAAGLHPALRFRFRPLTVEAFAAIMVAARTEANANQLFARVIEGRVQSWDLRDEKGQTQPVSAKLAAAMTPHLFDRLFDIVTGQKGSDVDPEAEAPAQRAENDAILAAVFAGRSVGEAREEIDEKN